MDMEDRNRVDIASCVFEGRKVRRGKVQLHDCDSESCMVISWNERLDQ